MGAAAEGFAYDNERPRHTVELPAFRIARHPVSNASWLSFSEGGGYERREWWSDEGWAWKEEYDITHHPGGGNRRPAGAGLPRQLVRGRRLRPRARRATPDGGGVGAGGDLEPAARRTRARGDRLRVGVDGSASTATRGSSRIPTGSTRRCSSTGLLRAARRLVGDRPRASRARPSATGTTRSAARSSRACAWRRERDGAARQPQQPRAEERRSGSTRTSAAPRSARSPRTCSTG